MTRLSQTSVPRNRASVFLFFVFFVSVSLSDLMFVLCVYSYSRNIPLSLSESIAVTTSVSLVVSKGLGVAPVSAPEHFAVIKGLLLSQ